MNMKLGLGAALLSASLLVGGAASAATVQLDLLGEAKTTGQASGQFYDPTVVRATLDCVDCLGLNSNVPADTASPIVLPVFNDAVVGDFQQDEADLFDGANSSDASELAFVERVSGLTFGSGNKYNLVDGVDDKENFSFFSSAFYILVKIGQDPNVTIIQNFGGPVPTLFTFKQVAGGSGLSHFTEFGTSPGRGTVIPLPAGLPLMLAGLGAFAFLARRKARKA